MRRALTALLALLLCALLTVAACGGSGSGGGASGNASGGASGGASGSSAPASPATSAAGLPAVTGAFGTKPQVAAPTGAPPGQLVAQVLVDGAGPVVGKGDLLVLDYVGETWRDGKVFDSSWDRGQPAAFPVGLGQLIAGFDETLVGKKVGSRVLLSIPPDKAYKEAGLPQAGIKGDDTIVFVADLLGSYGAEASAQGTPRAAAAGLPTVTGAAGTKPKVTFAADDRPAKKLVTSTVIQGTGPAVRKGQLLVAQYVGLTYPAGKRAAKQFDASWDRGQPAGFPIGMGRVIKGWDEGLVGVKAGSRVVMSVPPDKGYGTKGSPQAGIKGTDTLLFVVDVLGSYSSGGK